MQCCLMLLFLWNSIHNVIHKSSFSLDGEAATIYRPVAIKCDPASQNQQKVAWPSFVLWLEIGDQGRMGNF